MYITGYRFRKTLTSVALQVKINDQFVDATRSDYLYLLQTNKVWTNLIIAMLDISGNNPYATGKIALKYSWISRKVVLMVEEYDCLLTQYRKDFIKATAKHIRPEHLV